MSSNAPPRQTAIHYALHTLSPATETSHVVFREGDNAGFIVVRGDSADPQFIAAARGALGVDLPALPRQRVATSAVRAYGVSPDEWIVNVPEEELAERMQVLRRELSGHNAVVDVSGGYAMLELRGDCVPQVLGKSGVYDFAADRFVVGQAVQTLLAASPLLVARRDELTYELVVRRSFAGHVVAWLADAAREYGAGCDSAH